jgi:hypothetical protein
VAALWPDAPARAVLGVGNLAGLLPDQAVIAAPSGAAAPHGRGCVADPQGLPFCAASLDRALAAPGWCLPELWRVLRPQGRVLLLAPAQDWGPVGLRRALIAARFSPLRVRGFGGWPLFPELWLAEGEKRVFGRPPPRPVLSWGWLPRLLAPRPQAVP